MKKQKGGGYKEPLDLSAIFEVNIKTRFSSAFYSVFLRAENQMDVDKIDDLVELFTEGIEYKWGIINPSLDTTFTMTLDGPDYNTMQFLIAKYPQFVVYFIQQLEEKSLELT